jgi:serine/threonine-protein kinase HipA
MQLETLALSLGDQLIGHVYRYGGHTKLMFADDYISNPKRAWMSVSFAVPRDEARTRSLLAQFTANDRTGENGRLPVFLSNSLPEGALRDRIAAIAGISRDDEFGLAAACAGDLPGALRLQAVNSPEAALMQRLVTQNQDSLEPSVVAEPVPGAVSLSGIQPKLQLSKDTQGRYTFVAKRGRQHFIGKLPAPTYAGLPEVEFSSMQLARAAGVQTADCSLEPMSAIDGDIDLSHGKGKYFLSVKRFDRDAPAGHPGRTRAGRIHMEDFCQVLSLGASAKYEGNYLQLTAVLAGLGRDEDVIELIRRIVVNELLGNFDAHLKNFALLYTAPQAPVLSPAYDIVAYACFLKGRGHALRWTRAQAKATPLSNDILKHMADETQKTLAAAGLKTRITPQRLVREAALTRTQALDTWGALLPDLPLTQKQKTTLKTRWNETQL